MIDEPAKRAAAVMRRYLARSSGLALDNTTVPGADAPGFMLTPASQAADGTTTR